MCVRGGEDWMGDLAAWSVSAAGFCTPPTTIYDKGATDDCHLPPAMSVMLGRIC